MGEVKPEDIAEMQRLLDARYRPSSDRIRDRARVRLKRQGLIRFNRKAWVWEILPEGLAAIAKAEASPNA